MNKLSDYIDSLLSDALERGRKKSDGPYEISLLIPVTLYVHEKGIEQIITQQEVHLVRQSLNEIVSPEVTLNLKKADNSLIKRELIQFLKLSGDPDLDANRVLHDTCQRILVISWEAMKEHFDQLKIQMTYHEDNLFDYLTTLLIQKLTQKLPSLLAGPHQKIWIIKSKKDDPDALPGPKERMNLRLTLIIS